MSLDDRLREILQTPHQNSVGETVITFPTDKLIAQIKQAFADEGYEKPMRVRFTPGTKTTITSVPELMTGQEWYERFSNELCPPSPDGSTKNVHATYSIGEINEAAKRATGIANEDR